MTKDVFIFKRFECRHGMSSMKIGVDAVLLGAWANVSQVRKVLDVGCGCGVIALMCAQRVPEAEIFAIDVDVDSVNEATFNCLNSPWNERMHVSLSDFNSCILSDIDLIISNPPYFDSGVTAPDSSRLVARHQAALSPYRLLERGRDMLSDGGRLAMIAPFSQSSDILKVAELNGFSLERGCCVRGHSAAPVKRVMFEFGLGCSHMQILPEAFPVLVLEEAPGIRTSAHQQLCEDFYIK